MTGWKDVGTALLGSWPSQVSSWGREGIAAFVAELQARGLTPEMALVALRESDGRFPPAAGELAARARRDPDRPTFDEAFQQLYGPGGLFGFGRAGVVVSPWVVAFADRYGRNRLRLLEVDSVDYGDIKKRELRQSWEQFLEATDGRIVAQIARSGRSDLGRFDPVGALALRHAPQIER